MKGSTLAAIAVVGGGFYYLSKRGLLPSFAPSPAVQAGAATLQQPSSTNALLTALGGLLKGVTGKSTSGGGLGFGSGGGSFGGGGSSTIASAPSYGYQVPFNLSEAPPLYEAPAGTFEAVAPGVVSGITFDSLGGYSGDPNDPTSIALNDALGATFDPYTLDPALDDPSTWLSSDSGFETDLSGPADLSAEADNVSGSL